MSDLPSSAPDRSPPHSVEAEEHVIACCLLDDGESLNRALDRGVSGSDFYFPSNRLIFETLIEMRAAKKGISMEVLMSELQTSRQLDAIGGHAQLLKLQVGSTTHASYFIDQVKSKSQLRELIRVSTGAVEQAYQANGDAAELVERVRSEIEVVARGLGSSDLDSLEYKESRLIEKPAPTYTINGTTVCTPGNLTTLYSQAKVGKTAVVGAMIGASFASPGTIYDTFGIKGANPAGKAVVHFDTEQSAFDRQQMVKGAQRRVDEPKIPAWFKSYLLTGKSASECRRLVEQAIRKNGKKFKGVHSVHIDGIGDLVNNPNDEDECFPLVTKLHGLAIEFECPIIGVLHLNPSSETKGRGHLGSQLERKSESNLMLEKLEDGTTRLWATKQRGQMITKDKAVCFRWDDQHQMHRTVQTPEGAAVTKRGRPELYPFSAFRSIFPGKNEEPLKLAELHRRAILNKPIKDKQLFNVLERYVQDGDIECVEVQGQPRKYRLTV